MRIALDYATWVAFLQQAAPTLQADFTGIASAKQWQGYEAATQCAYTLHFPPLFPDWEEGQTLAAFAKALPETPPNTLLILMQAGNAALGFFEEGQLESHKVIRKYMVRQKQGKAQLNHLKTKGKSRLGSRIRLAQTKEFFEEINEKIADWELDDRVALIYYHASPLLWNGLFEAYNPPFFEKRDVRLRKVSITPQTPHFEELMRIHQWTLTGYVEAAENLPEWVEKYDLPLIF
jgi:hypothetical protein